MSSVAVLNQLLETEPVAGLAVLDQNMPMVSLVPFVYLRDPARFVILISDLSPTTGLLRQNPACSLLVHEPPQSHDPKSNHALTRLMVSGTAQFQTRAEAAQKGLESAYRQRFEITDTLLGLADFHFCEITISQGRFIQGFGKIFQLSGPNLEVMEPFTR